MSLDWTFDHPNSDRSRDGDSNSFLNGGEWQPHSELLYETEAPSAAVAKPHVNQSELLCKTGCGFYGYPAWQGNCSKCFKELQAKASHSSASGSSEKSVRISRPVFDPTNLKNKVTRSVSDVSDLPGKASMLINKKIDKLDEKRRQQLNKHRNNNIVKSIFRKAAIKDELTTGKEATSFSPTQEFESFLKTLSKEGGGAVRKQVSLCVEKLRKTADTQSLEETADQMQELYSSVHNMVTSHPAFAGLSSEGVSRLCSLTESYAISRLQPQLWAIVNANCEEQDLAIQNRIRSLSWISPELLGCKLDDSVEEMSAAVDSIIGELIEIDAKVIPSEKLSVLVSCSHQILQALSQCSSSPASADDFLPALIFSVIRANPPMLHSNLSYITNFAPHSQLQSGEAGYYFTNLCCAVTFIEKVCGGSLGLTEQEFGRHMSGNALPLHPKPPLGVTSLGNTLQRFNKAISTVQRISQDYDSIMKEMDELDESVHTEVQRCREENPLKVRQAHTVSSIRELLESGEPLLPDLPAPDILTLPAQEPKSSAAPLPECEEAFNLYYSLEDFESSSASLLDEPIPDHTVPLLDQSEAATLVDGGPLSLSMPAPLQPQYSGFRAQSNRIPSIPCEMGSVAPATTQAPSDAFGSPERKASLPPPLIPMTRAATTPPLHSPVTTQTTLESPSSSSDGDGAAIAPSSLSAPSNPAERKDTLEKVVDVLAGIADSIDQLL